MLPFQTFNFFKNTSPTSPFRAAVLYEQTLAKQKKIYFIYFNKCFIKHTKNIHDSIT